MKTIIGIDPGVTGGIAVFRDDVLQELHTVPRKKQKVDYDRLTYLLDTLVDEETTVWIEDVHSVFGSSAKSNFNFGHICGVLFGMCLMKGAKIHYVSPKSWQHRIWTQDDWVFKENGRKDTKGTSLNCAKRIFEFVDFRKSSRAKKFDHNLIDAALVGLYGTGYKN